MSPECTQGGLKMFPLSAVSGGLWVCVSGDNTLFYIEQRWGSTQKLFCVPPQMEIQTTTSSWLQLWNSHVVLCGRSSHKSLLHAAHQRVSSFPVNVQEVCIGAQVSVPQSFTTWKSHTTAETPLFNLSQWRVDESLHNHACSPQIKEGGFSFRYFDVSFLEIQYLITLSLCCSFLISSVFFIFSFKVLDLALQVFGSDG